VIVVVIILTALLLAIGLTLAIRPLFVVGLGIALFVVAGTWQAAASNDGRPGETPNGIAGFLLAIVWILLPWLLGVAVGGLIASRRHRASSIVGE